jgi:SAM-dependent methyltransferase
MSCSDTFDSHAENYDGELNQALSVSGEDRTFFARQRVAWLAGCLESINLEPANVLDYGCGTGGSLPFLFEFLKPGRILGVDLSARCLQVAHRSNRLLPVRFALRDEYEPDGSMDLAFCNGVFHHISPGGRQGAIRYILNSLRPGGVLALWENNPWNPGTRYVMSRIPFDRDAVPLSAPASRELARAAGFQVLRTDYYFIFPKIMKRLRSLEARLTPLPLGAQYQILCLKPQTA